MKERIISLFLEAQQLLAPFTHHGGQAGSSLIGTWNGREWVKPSADLQIEPAALAWHGWLSCAVALLEAQEGSLSAGQRAVIRKAISGGMGSLCDLELSGWKQSPDVGDVQRSIRAICKEVTRLVG